MICIACITHLIKLLPLEQRSWESEYVNKYISEMSVASFLQWVPFTQQHDSVWQKGKERVACVNKHKCVESIVLKAEFIPVALIVCSCQNYAQTVYSFVTEEYYCLYVPKCLFTVYTFSYFSALLIELFYFITKLCIQLERPHSCSSVTIVKRLIVLLSFCSVAGMTKQYIFVKCILLVCLWGSVAKDEQVLLHDCVTIAISGCVHT